VEAPAGLGRHRAVDRRGGDVHVHHRRADFAFVAICFAALGFKSASSLFWPIPQAYLDARIAAAVIALINSVGNLGGFVAPTTFGLLEQHTGSIQGGLYGLAATSIIAAIIVFAPAPHRNRLLTLPWPKPRRSTPELCLIRIKTMTAHDTAKAPIITACK
jgi:nitrate/nitrite transporter NarK